MTSQINQKDADQDQEIALLKHRIDDTDALAEELRQRVRKLNVGLVAQLLLFLLPLLL